MFLSEDSNHSRKKTQETTFRNKITIQNDQTLRNSCPSICNICFEDLKFQLHLSKEVWWRFIDQVGQCFIQTFHQTIQMTFSASFETGHLLRPAQDLPAGAAGVSHSVIPILLRFHEISPENQGIFPETSGYLLGS